MVVLSGAAYGSGFVISVLHYTGLGVPPWAISHQTFLAAGILFLVLTAASVSTGVAIERQWRREIDAGLPRRRRIVGKLGIALFSGVAATYFVMQVSGTFRAFAYFGFVALLLALAPHNLRIKVSPEPR